MSFSKSILKSATILICDDEKDIRDVLAFAFEDAGCHVLQSENPDEAWQLIHQHKVDCIISDIRMSDGNGVDFAKKINQTYPQIPFFLMTGFTEYQGSEVREFGVEALFFKPFVVAEVVEAVALKLQSL